MGCYTLYVVREQEGSLWVSGSKWGPVEFDSADELLGHLDTLERRPASEEGVLDPSWCRGWFVDRGRRLSRMYPCSSGTYERFLQERRMRAASGWRGWDVGIAWEGVFEVAALAGLPVVDDEHFERLDGWIGCTEARLLTCYVDPARFAHRWNASAEELVHEWYFLDHGGVDLTIIDAAGRVRDHGFEDRHVLFEALGHGPRLLEVLRDVAPCPGVITSNAGAVIDEQERSIRYWIEPGVAATTLAELRRRWPGFTIERERAGLAGHLQRSGRLEELGEQSGWPEADPPYAPADPPRALRFIHARAVNAEELAPAPIPADEARLLAAVYADPSSDSPRRAYAELLLAKGHRRGALIHVQCEIRLLIRAGDRSARRRALAGEEMRLLRWYGHAVVAPAHLRRFGRGFVEAVDVDEVTTLVGGEVLRDFPTIDEVEITRPVAAADVRDLGAASGIERLRALSLHPRAGALTELAGSVVARGLRRLVLHGGAEDVAAELGAAIATGCFEELEALDLRGKVFDARVAEILGAARLPKLARLTIGSASRFGVEGARALASRPIGALTSLALYSVGLDDDGAEVLAASAQLAGLVAIDLAGNAIHERGAAALVASPSLAGLRDLGLDNCPIEDAAARHLATMPELSRLRSLSLCRCGITAEGVLVLARSPYLRGLDELAISRGGGPRIEYERALDALREALGDAVDLR